MSYVALKYSCIIFLYLFTGVFNDGYPVFFLKIIYSHRFNIDCLKFYFYEIDVLVNAVGWNLQHVFKYIHVSCLYCVYITSNNERPKSALLVLLGKYKIIHK